MKTLKQTDILDNKIAALKIKRAKEFIELKQQYFIVHNSFTITNIVQQGVTEFYNTATNKDNLFTTITSLIGGYLTKKMVVGESKNPFKQILGYGVQFAVTKLLSKITNKKTIQDEKF
jgi:hypothetical protein